MTRRSDLLVAPAVIPWWEGSLLTCLSVSSQLWCFQLGSSVQWKPACGIQEEGSSVLSL